MYTFGYIVISYRLPFTNAKAVGFNMGPTAGSLKNDTRFIDDMKDAKAAEGLLNTVSDVNNPSLE